MLRMHPLSPAWLPEVTTSRVNLPPPDANMRGAPCRMPFLGVLEGDEPEVPGTGAAIVWTLATETDPSI